MRARLIATIAATLFITVVLACPSFSAPAKPSDAPALSLDAAPAKPAAPAPAKTAPAPAKAAKTEPEKPSKTEPEKAKAPEVPKSSTALPKPTVIPPKPSAKLAKKASAKAKKAHAEYAKRPAPAESQSSSFVSNLPASSSTTSSTAPVKPTGKTFVFGVNPWDKPDVMRKMFRPLMDYLTEKTGYKFRISIAPTYDQLIVDMGNGYVQLGNLNAVSYLKATRKYPGLRYLATAVQDNAGENRDYYEGFIIVRKDSPYRTLEDLRNKRFAFVDVDSNSGYKMPLALMGQQGLDPDTFFKKYFFVGDHNEVAKAVKNRSVDGGATWDNGLKVNTKRYGQIFRIILRTPHIPNEAWVTGVGVPAAAAEKIKQVLLGIDATTRTADGRIVADVDNGFPNTGWSERSDKLYQDVAPLLFYEPKK